MMETKQFFESPDYLPVPVMEYDFSRLDSTRGLYVFSYQFSGDVGSAIVGFKKDTLSGIRVWEYDFQATHPEKRDMLVEFRFWGFRDMSKLFLGRSGYTVTIHPTFQRGAMVYGGRLIVDEYLQSLVEEREPLVVDRRDEDLGEWIANYGLTVPNLTMPFIPMGTFYEFHPGDGTFPFQ
jgi:hypothetical protein